MIDTRQGVFLFQRADILSDKNSWLLRDSICWEGGLAWHARGNLRVARVASVVEMSFKEFSKFPLALLEPKGYSTKSALEEGAAAGPSGSVPAGSRWKRIFKNFEKSR